MALPKKLYFTLDEVSKKLNCSISDLIHFAVYDEIELCVKLSSESIDIMDNYPRVINSNENEDALNKIMYPYDDNIIPTCKVSYYNKYGYIVESFMNNPDTNEYPSLFGFCTLFSVLLNNKSDVDIINNGFFFSREFSIPRTGLLEKDQAITPHLICFKTPLKINVNQLVVTDEEIALFSESLGKGENQQKPETNNSKTRNAQAQFIKSLLSIMYDDDVAESPRRYIDNPDSELRRDFEAKKIIMPTGKTIQSWVSFVDIPYKGA